MCVAYARTNLSLRTSKTMRAHYSYIVFQISFAQLASDGE